MLVIKQPIPYGETWRFTPIKKPYYQIYRSTSPILWSAL